MNRNLKAGLAGLATLGALAAAGAAGISPAQATVLDTDRPIVTESHFDFGKNWSLGAPRNGGYLDWDLTGGVVTASTEGYLYLTDQECGRLHVDYYEADGTFIDHDLGDVHCAPGNGKTQWWESYSFSDPDVMTVTVRVQRENSNGSFTTMGSDTEDFD